MSAYPDHWGEVPLAQINTFTSKTVDPASLPHQKFELYSVPSFPSRRPETAYGGAIGSTKQAVAPNDVLVCKINPRINRVWQVGAESDLPQIASSEWIVVRTPEFDARFLQRYFSGPEFRDLLCQDLTGVGGSLTRAQPKRVATLPIPVPPLEEQTRIADKLDTLLARVDACSDRLDRVPVILQRFRQAVLTAAFSGNLSADWRLANGLTTVKRWDLVSLPAVAEARLGKMLDKVKNQGIPTRYLRNVNVRWFDFELDDLLEIKVSASEQEELAIRDGDILICEGGEPGRCAVWAGGTTDLIFQKALHRVRVKPALHPEWLCFSLKHAASSGALEKLFTGSTIKHLTGTALAQYRFPLPSIEEQTEIVRRVSQLFALADRLEERLESLRKQADRLAPAVLAKAFRGELVPQDPNDEPAAMLLARIRESRSTSQLAPALGRLRKQSA